MFEDLRTTAGLLSGMVKDGYVGYGREEVGFAT